MNDDNSVEVMNNDVLRILRALGLSDHARPYSCHRVVEDEILPAIERTHITGVVDTYRRGLQDGFDRAIIRSIEYLSEAGMQDAISVLQKKFRTDYDPKNEEATHFRIGTIQP